MKPEQWAQVTAFRHPQALFVTHLSPTTLDALTSLMTLWKTRVQSGAGMQISIGHTWPLSHLEY